MCRFKSALENTEGVTLGHFMEGKPGALSGLTAFFRGPVEGDPGAGAAAADLFLALNASTIELADFETYVNETVGPARPVVSWNMELDLLRADLGLLGFPPKDLQYRFLSAFKPVFYIRQRDYSKTVAVAPFIINYSGALFREFPGPWQVMLRQDNGVYACVAGESRGAMAAEGLLAACLLRFFGEDMVFVLHGIRAAPCHRAADELAHPSPPPRPPRRSCRGRGAAVRSGRVQGGAHPRHGAGRDRGLRHRLPAHRLQGQHLVGGRRGQGGVHGVAHLRAETRCPRRVFWLFDAFPFRT